MIRDDVQRRQTQEAAASLERSWHCSREISPTSTRLGMRSWRSPLWRICFGFGEASGATVALLVLRAALACHTGMATFGEAGVSNKS